MGNSLMNTEPKASGEKNPQRKIAYARQKKKGLKKKTRPSFGRRYGKESEAARVHDPGKSALKKGQFTVERGRQNSGS